MKKILVFVVAVSFLFSCEKLKNENIIPDSQPRLTELQTQYKNTLVDAPLGWYIEYAPSANKGATSILMKFREDEKVEILSELAGFETEKISTYRVAGVNRPELIFNTYSVWSAIAETSGGSFEFLLFPQTDGSFVLRHVLGANTQSFTLRKATSADKDNILAKLATTQLLKSFYENATGYFKNISLQNISAFFDLNIVNQQLTLKWLQGSEIKSKIFSYVNIPSGIRLMEDWVVGNITVRDIVFGSLGNNSLKIVSAGNAGSGQIEGAHIPAFPFKGTSDYFIQQNGAERFYAYTLTNAADYYSPALLSKYQILKESVGSETFLVQLYNHNGTAPNYTNSIQFRYIMPSGSVMPDGSASGWMAFYYNIVKVDDSHLIITPTGTFNSVGAPFVNQVNNFLSDLFPPEGVTVVPYGRAGALQRIRLVSRKNSKYYIMVTVSTPGGIYLD